MTAQNTSSSAPIDPKAIAKIPRLRVFLVFLTGSNICVAAGHIAKAWVLATIIQTILLGNFPSPTRLCLWGGMWCIVTLLQSFMTVVSSHEPDKIASHLTFKNGLYHLVRLDAQRFSHYVSRFRAGLSLQSESMRPYFTEYIPALVASIVMVPLIIAAIGWVDWISALIVVVLLPCIPIFMILIGKLTAEKSSAKVQELMRLSETMTDAYQGVSTVQAVRRTHAVDNSITRVAHAYGTVAQSVSKIIFLSSAVLEFIATFSVAIVAVNIGMRLIYGKIELVSALFIFIIIAEVYTPLRKVGAAFHASEDGRLYMDSMLEIPDDIVDNTPERTASSTTDILEHEIRPCSIQWDEETSLHYPMNHTITPGDKILFRGDNGAGKTTLMRVLLGHITSTPDISLSSRWERTYLPVEPLLIAQSVRTNLVALSPDISVDNLLAHIRALDLWEGLSSYVDEESIEYLSLGQRQFLCVARILALSSIYLAENPTVIVLDEPVQFLDRRQTQLIEHACEILSQRGAVVIVATHAPGTFTEFYPLSIETVNHCAETSTNIHENVAKQSSHTSFATRTTESKNAISKNVPTSSTLLHTVLAVLLGIGTLLSACGLAMCSAWLIVRAWQQPTPLEVSIAVVSVRALGVSRALFRYGERVMTHNVLFARRAQELLSSYRLYCTRGFSVNPLPGKELLESAFARADVHSLVYIPSAIAVVTCVFIVGMYAFFSWYTAFFMAVGLIISVLVLPLVGGAVEKKSVTRASESLEECLSVVELCLKHREELVVTRGIGHYEQRGQALLLTRDRALTASHNTHAVIVAGQSIVIALIVMAQIWMSHIAYGHMSAPVLGMLLLAPLLSFEVASVSVPAVHQWLRAQQAAVPHNDAEELAEKSEKVFDRIVQEQPDFSSWHYHSPAPSIGKIASLCGPNGSGKSSLIAYLAGLIVPPQPTKLPPELHIESNDFIASPKQEREAIYTKTVKNRGEQDTAGATTESFPSPQLSSKIQLQLCTCSSDPVVFIGHSHVFATSVYQNLCLIDPTISGLDSEEILDRVGLWEILQRKNGIHTHCSVLSQGQKRLVVYAQFLLAQSSRIFFDEPLTNISTDRVDNLIEILCTNTSEKDILLASHHDQLLHALSARGHQVIAMTAHKKLGSQY